MSIQIVNKLRGCMYVIIPCFCFIFWAFISLWKDNFSILIAPDFPTFYYVTHLIFTEPEKLYFFTIQPYPYTPFFAMLLFPLSFVDILTAHYIFLIIIVILSQLCIIIFNQILILKKVNKKIYRFVFLIVLSNGIIWMQMYDCLTGRIFTAFGLLWFLKREIKYRDLNKDLTDNKFIFTQMLILIFAIGVGAQFFFLILLYLFQNVKFKEILSKLQIKRYLLLILAFIVENFMFIIIFLRSPEAIMNFLGGGSRGIRHFDPKYYNYTIIEENRIYFHNDGMTSVLMVLSMHADIHYIESNIFYVSLIIMSVITLLIHLKKNLTVEQKFGLWSLLCLSFYTLTSMRYMVGIVPLIAIIFLDYEIEEPGNIIDFFKKNSLIIVGLICLMALYFMPPIHYLIRVFPWLYFVPIELVILRWVFIYIILTLDVYILLKYKPTKWDLTTVIEET